MNSLWLELAVILLLLVANGVFSMAEIAVVSARRPRLRALAEAGDSRARRALALAEAPTSFLATVQVGITLVGVLAAAFGGAAVAERLAVPLSRLQWLAPYAEETAFGLVVVALTYGTLVIGELAPKRIGLGQPELTACRLAGPMYLLSRICAPVVGLLARSTDALLGLLRIRPAPEAAVTDEDVRLLVREGMRAGVFHAQEPAMVESVMSLDRRPIRDLMTPRPKIIWININDTHETIWHRIVVSAHTTFPVHDGNRDHVVGLVNVKSIYANLAAGVPVRVRDLVTPALFVPPTLTVTALLERFKESGRHVALVRDEQGAVAGLVSLHDVMEAIVGRIPSLEDRMRPRALRRDDGSWLVDGRLEVDEFTVAVPDCPLPGAAPGRREAVGDWVVRHLGRVPAEGESFGLSRYMVEVIDLDGAHVDKILLLPATGSSSGR